MELYKSSHKLFVESYNLLKRLQAIRTFEAESGKDEFVCASFADGASIREALRVMSQNRRGIDYDKTLASIRLYEEHLNSTRVGTESLSMLFNESSYEFVIFEPKEMIKYSTLTSGKIGEMLKKSTSLPQSDLIMVVAMDERHLFLWMVSTHLVSGPIKHHLKEGNCSKKELIELANRAYPGFHPKALKNVVVAAHPKNGWIIELLKEEKLGHFKATLAPDVDETTLEKMIMNFPEEFYWTKILSEFRELEQYFVELDSESGKATRGRRSTGYAINNRMTKMVLVSETNNSKAFVFQAGNKDRIILRDADDEVVPAYHGQQVREKMPFMAWLRKNPTKVKGNIILISLYTELGRRLERECQGIGAILDARRDLPSDED